MSILSDLKKQLAAKGVREPERCTGGDLVTLDDNATRAVSGGFGQVVGFGQAFNQTSGGGYTQTTFTQNFGQSLA